MSAEEAGEFIDQHGPGVIFERDGRVAGYAAGGESGATIVLVDSGNDPGPALEVLAAWLGERGHHVVDTYASDVRRIAWLEAHGFTHRRSSFDLHRGINPPPAPAVRPSAVAVARYRPGEDDHAAHALIYVDAAWGEVPGHTQLSLEAWRSMLTPDYCGWVARRDGRPVGWVVGRVFSDGRGWIQQLAVARSARGVGLGRALLLHSLAELRSRGATSLAPGVQAENENAIGCTATSASRSHANGASTRDPRPEPTNCRSFSPPASIALIAWWRFKLPLAPLRRGLLERRVAGRCRCGHR